MSKSSSFERIIGDISDAEKSDILRKMEDRFADQFFAEFEGKERKKTPEELKIISLANAATNQWRRKYGLKDFNVPQNNVHIIAENMWPQEKGTALFNSMLQAIAMREQPAKLVLVKKVFHEMLHFKSYQALQVTSPANPVLSEYRLGLTAQARDGERIYFGSLNEAVTEEITKEFLATVVSHPLFAQEVQQTRAIRVRHPNAVTASGEPLLNDDTFYVSQESRSSWRDALGRLFGGRRERVSLVAEEFTYKRERNMLNTLIDKILDRNRDRFADRGEVFDVFARSMMTGNMLPLGRLIERTFGHRTFRTIAEGDIGDQEELIKSL